MPLYGRRYRRRRSSRALPGTRRMVKYSRGTDFPAYTKDYSHLKLMKIHPEGTTSESWYFNSNMNGALPASQNFHLLNDIPLGTGVNFRNTSRLRMRWLILKIGIQSPVNYVPANNPVRWCAMTIFYDKEPYGETVDFSDVWDGPDPITQQKFINRDRFEILYRADRMFGMTPVYNGTSQIWVSGTSTYRAFDLKIPINRLTTFNTDQSGGIGAMRRGALWIWFNNVDAGSVNNNWRAYISHKLSFTDID